jgi:Cdc6-like AAA superfamily ATPase
MKKAFYAYPANPAIMFTIRNGIKSINASQDIISVHSWEELKVTGKYIIDEVCEAIDDADVFLCDLTFTSANVLFELGYAIANNKRIWISVDPTLLDDDNYQKELRPLTTIGYAKHRNSEELTQKFLSDAPYSDIENTIYSSIFKSISETDRKEPSLFYLKSVIPTEASIELTRYLNKTDIIVITDDVQETTSRPLTWYVENVYRCFGVMAHLIDERREGKSYQNAKYALVCGMAYALGKRVSIIAHVPYSSPIDFRDILISHTSPDECRKIAEEWVDKNKSAYVLQKDKYKQLQKKLSASRTLQRINLGEYEAENEEEELINYFYETPAYNEAINTSQYTIFVGRKGSGKTASLYQMVNELKKSKQENNHVCVIKPIDYEVEGIFNIFNLALAKAEKSYLVESLWKFLIYTDLAYSVYSELKSKPVHYIISNAERAFIEYVDQHSTLIKSEFTVRMDKTIQTFSQLDVSGDIEQQRNTISNLLHVQFLSQLRGVLGDVLSKKGKVFILVDNLDKAWQPRQDLDVLAEFLFGLLGVGQAIAKDFHKQNSRTQKVEVALVVFIRSDIFSYIMNRARERDKLKYAFFNWNDRMLLRRVIEERFVHSFSETLLPDEVWDKFFVQTVKGIPTRDYLVDRIIPRPRDAIFFCKQALAQAISHRHSIVDEEDVFQAEKEYSLHAYSSLLAEIEAQLPGIEELIIEFAGSSEIISRQDIEDAIKRTTLTHYEVDEIIELLCNSTFLGLEVRVEEFEFIYDETRKKVFKSLASKIAEIRGMQRFKINVPFHAYLGIN